MGLDKKSLRKLLQEKELCLEWAGGQQKCPVLMFSVDNTQLSVVYHRFLGLQSSWFQQLPFKLLFSKSAYVVFSE